MLERIKKVLKDIRALVCLGGIRVDTYCSSGSTDIAIKSTVQLDGDVTTTIARSEISNLDAMLSHMHEIESRLQSVAKYMGIARYSVNGIITAVAAVLAVRGVANASHDTAYSLISIIFSIVLFVGLKSSFIPKHITAFVINVLSRKAFKQVKAFAVRELT